MNWNKILFLTSEFPPQPGGIGKHAHDLAMALSLQQRTVHVLTDRRSATGEEEYEFDAKLPFKVTRVKRRKWLPLTYLHRIWKALRLLSSCDGILVSGKFSLWMVSVLKRCTKKPFIAIIHGSEVQLPNPKQRRFTHKCLEKCTVVIAVSNHTASLVSHLDLQKLMVIPNGIFPLKEPQSHEVPKSLQLITVGNLTQRKGQHNVIAALPMILKQFPGLQYHMVGLPTEMDKLKELAEGLGVAEHVQFHGRVSDEEKETLLKEASIFIMLSEQTQKGDTEGFGIAILEANALGLPAIGAKDCGIEDAISHGNSGMLVSPHNPTEIANAIETIMLAYAQFSTSARVWSKGFNWNQIVTLYLKAMES